jgi:hypothetical protein
MASAPTQKNFATRSAPRLFVLALCAVFSSAPTTLAADDHKTFFAFEIEVGSKTGIFPSPGYTVSILGSGRVNYRGYDKVHRKGKQHGRISLDAVEQLVEHVRSPKVAEHEVSTGAEIPVPMLHTANIYFDGAHKKWG